MPIRTELTQRLGLAVPVIQAPMAGGATTVELVAAVSEAGALGSIGAAGMTAAQIVEGARAVRARTGQPFGMNLFAPQPAPAPVAEFGPALQRVAPFYAELGLPPPEAPAWTGDPFEAQFAAVLESKPSVFSFTFGLLPASAIEAIKARGIFLIGTATTVEEAAALERAGVDAVVAQGSEAGGHRGTFAGEFEAAMVGSMALVPAVVGAVSVPVIAAGGIMDGRGIAAALALGASAAQMGTAFLACDEAGISEAHKAAILQAREAGTRVTRAFSGRPARGIVNRLMTHIDTAPDTILPYPLQGALTGPIRRAGEQRDEADYLSLWAGQGVSLARRQPAAELVARLAGEMEAAVRWLAGRSMRPRVDGT